MKNLRREIKQKFKSIIIEWIIESPAITDVTGNDEFLENAIETLCDRLADACVIKSERHTDDTFGGISSNRGNHAHM